MKKFLALLLAALLCLAAGCADNEDTPGKELTDITVCLDWTPNTNHTGMFVAAARGYYEEAGLNVELVQPPEDGAAPLVAANRAQFGVTAQDTIADAFTGDAPLPITAVATLLQHNSSGLISRGGEGLDEPKNLEGKMYATWNSPIEMGMIDHVMAARGGDLSKVQLIPNNITDEPGALAAHQADAIWVFYGWGGLGAKVRDFDFDFFFFKDFDPAFDFYTPVLVANNDFLEKDPESAKAFLAATARGYEDAIADPEGAAQILIESDTTGSLAGSEELVIESQKWMCNEYKAEVERWGYIDPARWDSFYTWLTEKGLCETPLEPGTGFSNEYLP